LEVEVILTNEEEEKLLCKAGAKRLLKSKIGEGGKPNRGLRIRFPSRLRHHACLSLEVCL
jgi:hypothetical protein